LSFSFEKLCANRKKLCANTPRSERSTRACCLAILFVIQKFFKQNRLSQFSFTDKTNLNAHSNKNDRLKKLGANTPGMPTAQPAADRATCS
jgi:hypothetical protein